MRGQISLIGAILLGLAGSPVLAQSEGEVVTKQYDDGSVYQGTFVNGLPRQIEPLLLCIPFELEDWIRDNLNVQPWMEPLLKQLVDSLTKEIKEEIEDWFSDPGVPELQDNNNNTVPDFIESSLCVVGSEIPGLESSGECLLDENGDGLPDFTQDPSGAGVPQLFNPNPPEGDRDGDGIPDEHDVDSDNNGIPDYAE